MPLDTDDLREIVADALANDEAFADAALELRGDGPPTQIVLSAMQAFLSNAMGTAAQRMDMRDLYQRFTGVDLFAGPGAGLTPPKLS